ncbi:MAG: ATP-binding protein [Pseudomonadota bacterium]
MARQDPPDREIADTETGPHGGYAAGITSRLRDFAVIVIGATFVLALLAVSGSMGWVEAVTAAIIIASGSGAYLVGSSGSPAPNRGLPQKEIRERTRQATELKPVVDALPMPALHVGVDGRLDCANADARKVFRLQSGQRSLASAVLRNPALINAVEHALNQYSNGTVEYVQTGIQDQVWMVHVSALAKAGGGALLVLEDKTAMRRAEKARADFLANASHELRTPLTSVSGFIETMRGPAKDDKESWDRFLEIMFEQTERMRRLIADLLSLSRIEFSEHRPPSDTHDLKAIVTRATQALVPLATEREISLTLDAPPDAAYAVADPDEMTQAVQNLITNAVKYSPDGGHVQVELGHAPSLDAAKSQVGRHWEDGARMTILEAPRDEDATAIFIRVTDEGQGIGREHLPRLGQRFYRVDASRGGKITGTGLGLAIVKHVMTRHRGGVIVESLPGRGSGFGLWLPAAKDTAGLTPPVPAPDERLEQGVM